MPQENSKKPLKQQFSILLDRDKISPCGRSLGGKQIVPSMGLPFTNEHLINITRGEWINGKQTPFSHWHH